MSGLRLVHLTSLDRLRDAAAAWDDLWWRSDVTLPTSRAELLAQWIEHFAPDACFHALAVEDHGQWVAALPLVGCRLAGVVGVGTMPSCEWSSSGELLLDPSADVPAVVDLLAAAARRLPWQLLRLHDTAIGTPRWDALCEAFDRAGMASDVRHSYDVALIEIGEDWEAYRRGWSRKHRQKMSSAARCLARQGDLHHRVLAELAPERVEPWLVRGWEVEDRSWKGTAGSSVLKRPGLAAFFRRQAEQLARWGQLRMDFLESAGRPVAFAYGMTAKDVYHSYRIGYDPELAAYSPGQLLRCRMLEGLFADGRCRALDCQGPLTDAQRSWRPIPYTVGRIAVAPQGRLGRLLLSAYRLLRPPTAAAAHRRHSSAFLSAPIGRS